MIFIFSPLDICKLFSDLSSAVSLTTNDLGDSCAILTHRMCN